ncbi:hypothetical protein CDD80_1995 [Ophiocordyceps camponoti-rufipedis]|uniref:YCII-related domain-containing protein n=1 Tax=Ophiocordyceps camponoti-rufipedis TaxID=2004952 RepID=A0A2C5XL21_9HYPO|nr:hypothetical protein CDD80_1995 [Ophiocordyceps camponoti-rufipedis]
MPRYMFLIKSDPHKAETGNQQPPKELFEAMARFNEEMAHAGVLIAAEGFRPTAEDGYRICFNDKDQHETVSGPFDVSKEDHICGFWLIQTKSTQEALSWAKKVPFKEGELVMRKVGYCHELGDNYTQDLKNREDKLRNKMEQNAKAVVV